MSAHQPATKLVAVCLSAITRVEYREVVEVPADITDDELNKLVNSRYVSVDGGQYQDDPNYWERGDCHVEMVGARESAEVRLVDRDAGTVKEIVAGESEDPARPRIWGRFLKQEWGGRKGDTAIPLGVEEFDATAHVLGMSLDDIHELVDHSETTDRVGLGHIDHDGPHEVDITESIAQFFGVEGLTDITDDMLEAKREVYGVAVITPRARP